MVLPRCATAAIIAAAAITTAGCTSNVYRIETTLHPDGQVERSLYQPAGGPTVGVAAPAWERVVKAEKIEHTDWDRPIRGLPEGNPKPGEGYVAAWGKFPSAEAIPTHFVRKSADGAREGRLVPTSSKTDLGLVTEHVWDEWLTNTVSLNDLRDARRELADLSLQILTDVLREELGPDYDFDRLIAFLRADGILWFEEMTNVYLEVALRREPNAEQRLQKEMEALAARRGLASLEKEAISDFAALHLRLLIRDREGKPLSDQRVTEILRWLGIHAEKPMADSVAASPFDAAAKRVIERRYGGEDAIQKRLGSLADRIIGVYGIFGGLEKFHASVTMPGVIVESTGVLNDNQTTTWTFTAADAYPFGYRMRARSLERHPQINRVFGRDVLSTRADRIAFADLVRRHDALIQLLSECMKTGSRDPWTKLVQEVEAGEDAGKKKELARVRRLLEKKRP